MAEIEVGFPFQLDAGGRVASPDYAQHVYELIEQLLFTAPGERVNRPDFGSGLLRLVFEPSSDALAAATRLSVEGALQRWLGDLIQVEAVQVRNIDSLLEVSVQYVVRRTQERRIERFRGTGAG
jgi:hypothetical protein